MKVFFRRIHLYLSLAAGLVIMTCCFTGAVLVFEHELQHLFSPGRYFVQPTGTVQSAQALENSLKIKIPGITINSMKWYTDPTRSVEISYAAGITKKPGTVAKQDVGKKAKGERKPDPAPRKTAFLNPYTAEVIEVYNYSDSFFYSMMSLHRWLLGGPVGKLIVGICTLIFLVIIITGIILWWPKTRNILQQRLRLKWNAGWKRINHDLHIVVGFYSAIFLFIFSFTGLAWSFEWFNKGIYTLTKSTQQGVKPPVIAYKENIPLLPLDSVFSIAKVSAGAVEFYQVTLPKDSTAPFSVNVLRKDAVHESATDNYFIDRYSPTVAGVVKWEDRNLGQRVRATFKPVHISSIFGMPSKIIGLVICLLGVTFPITGVIMWLNRTRKKNAAARNTMNKDLDSEAA